MGGLGDDHPTECDFTSVLASQGVEFLLSGEDEVPFSSCNGKTVCLFFSAEWCRPCRTFCPQLVQIYNNLQTKGANFEIIFISFDRDQDGFNQHYKSMPWLTVPFYSNLHKRLSEIYHIDRIPLLISLSSDGLSAGEDLITFIEDYGVEAFPFTKHRRQELLAMDAEYRLGGDLEDLLTHQGRKYVISRDSKKIAVSELVGKTIGLYFGAHWCPPSCTFTEQLIEVYSNLKKLTSTDQLFEIIFISTDRDSKEYDINLSGMPWLAIPYEDKKRQDLCRIFNIQGIPSLVLIGPDGKTITTDGKAIIMLYGAKAYPFTESRIKSLEVELRKEGEALPNQVKDRKHGHLLKLEMAKGYVCDCCQLQGRFWALSCHVCDYDLHPHCIEPEC